MSDIDRLRTDLEDARADLLAAFEGIPQDAFERSCVERPDGEPWAIRDLLWHVGLFEDWTRRTVDVGVRGGMPAAYTERTRPTIAQTPEYLGEWLAQSRRPLLALLRRLPEDGLDASFTLADGESMTARWMLERVIAHDREHADQIATLGARPERGEGASHGHEEAS